MRTLILPLFFSALAINGLAAEKDTRCFELRTYYAAPGKLDELHARFRDHTMKIFEKHGMSNIGYWVPVDNSENKLVYLLAFPSQEARSKSWKEFGGDPEWKAAQKASEVNGPLVAKVVSILMTATDYSPMVTSHSSAEPRLFELRTYTATPGHVDDLHARFRNHTLGLFEKHGMMNFGYWTPLDKKQGSENTLIYLLAHKNSAASDASWKGFRGDPDWIAVKKASEDKAGGSLTTDVKSVFLKATDYSPTK